MPKTSAEKSDGNGGAKINVKSVENAVRAMRSQVEAQKRYYAFGTKAYPQLHASLSVIERELGIEPQADWGVVPTFSR